MANIGKVLTNPIVLGGGLAIGLLVLITKSSGAAAATSVSGYNPAVLSANVQMNLAALGAASTNIKTSAELEKSRFAKDVAMQSQVISYIKNVNDNNTRIGLERLSSQAGITQQMLSSSAMLVMDIQNNSNRLALGQQETQRTQINADASVSVAKAQASGQKVAAIASAVGSIAGSAAKAITGGI